MQYASWAVGMRAEKISAPTRNRRFFGDPLRTQLVRSILSEAKNGLDKIPWKQEAGCAAICAAGWQTECADGCTKRKLK